MILKSAVTGQVMGAIAGPGCRSGTTQSTGQQRKDLVTEHSQALSTQRMSESNIRIAEVRIFVTIASPSKDSVPESATVISRVAQSQTSISEMMH
jgi:hypothetical protein